MSVVRNIIFILLGLYIIYYVITIQIEKFPVLLVPTIIVLVAFAGLLIYKYLHVKKNSMVQPWFWIARQYPVLVST